MIGELYSAHCLGIPGFVDVTVDSGAASDNSSSTQCQAVMELLTQPGSPALVIMARS